MSFNDTNRAPGICAVSYSALSPTCSRTRSGSARCTFNQPASTTSDCRGPANTVTATKHASIKSILFIEVSFDHEDGAGWAAMSSGLQRSGLGGGRNGSNNSCHELSRKKLPSVLARRAKRHYLLRSLHQ